MSVTSIPAATAPRPPNPQHHSTPQAYPRSEIDTTAKAVKLGWLGWNHGCLGRSAWTLRLHRLHSIQQSSPLGQGIHSTAMEPDQTRPLGPLLQQLGSKPHACQSRDSSLWGSKLQRILVGFSALFRSSGPGRGKMDGRICPEVEFSQRNGRNWRKYGNSSS